MKMKVFAFAALALSAPGSNSSANASTTTYTYDGSTITSATGPILSAQISGAVTFDFDTSSFTGVLNYSDITSLHLNDYNGSAIQGNFTLSDGAITSWDVDTYMTPQLDILYQPTTTTTTDTLLYAYNLVCPHDGSCTYQTGTLSGPSGSWSGPNVSAAPLPAALPLFAGGLAFISFVVGRRKRKTIAQIARSI